MDLNRLAITARLRSPWESVDLGVLLARRCWWPMFAVWLLPAAVVFSLCAVLFWQHPSLSLALVWWLKPLYDRLPLFIASRALFSTDLAARPALRQFFATNRTDWFSWLTLRRLSVTRSFDMPISVLEGSGGATRNGRLAILHRKSAGAASWLTLVCFHIELILLLGLSALIYLLLPEQIEIDWVPLISEDSIAVEWIINGLSLAVMAAVAPFYICGGFMLYIGRRIELEAWDIEISFRKLAQRLSEKSAGIRSGNAPGAVAQIALVILLATTMGASPTAIAQNQIQAPAQAQQLIDETLAGEDFHQLEMKRGWRLKETGGDGEIPQWLIAFLEWLENRDVAEDKPQTDIGPLFASVVEFLLWLAAASLVAYLLWRYRAQIRASFASGTRTKTGKPVTPETLFGLDVRKDSLPQDVCSEVLNLWHTGAQRASLGLLYRATLAHLIEQFHFQFSDHHTEQECAQLVHERSRIFSQLQHTANIANQKHNAEQTSGSGIEPATEPENEPAVTAVTPELTQLVAALTSAWQQLAYAHQSPETHQLQTLCLQWRGVFGNED